MKESSEESLKQMKSNNDRENIHGDHKKVISFFSGDTNDSRLQVNYSLSFLIIQSPSVDQKGQTNR
jgi:hypothetical protein